MVVGVLVDKWRMRNLVQHIDTIRRNFCTDMWLCIVPGVLITGASHVTMMGLHVFCTTREVFIVPGIIMGCMSVSAIRDCLKVQGNKLFVKTIKDKRKNLKKILF